MIKKLILILVCLVFFTTCKKGEDDPLISLRSRKTRLSGEWSLQSGKLTESIDDHLNNLRHSRMFTFTTGRYEASENAPYYTIYKGIYSLGLNIDKNGTFTMREQFDGRELSAEGVWDFLQASDDKKKKEELNFIIYKVSKGSTSEYHLFNWALTTMRYSIKELRNKELVLTVANDAMIDPGYIDLNYTGEFVFTQD